MKIKDTELLLTSHAELLAALQIAVRIAGDKGSPSIRMYSADAISKAIELRAALGRPL